jgi:ribonuclease HI
VIHLDFSNQPYQEVDGAATAIFSDICTTRFPGFCLIFTDGSVSAGPPQSVGSGMVIPSLSHIRGWRLDPGHTIVAAELYGILQALKYLSANRTLPAVICTDSRSSLQLLQQAFPSNYTHLVAAIQMHLHQLPTGAVHLQWVPSHAGLQGNEAADKAAKQAAASADQTAQVPFDFSELKSVVHRSIWNFWQLKWTSIRGQFALGMIKPSVHPWAHRMLQTRRFETLFARLRLGTAPLNKSLFQIRQAPSPLGPSCQVPETAHHYLIACIEYAEARSQLRRQINSQGILVLSLGTLLGGDTASSRTWPQTCRAVENFISSTHRFDP